MKFSKIDYTSTPINEYRVYGCKEATVNEPQPQIFASTIFAIDTVYAKARFLQLMNKQQGLKGKRVSVLRVEEIPQETDLVLRNYSVTFTYRSRDGMHNACREVRNVNRVLAVADIYHEFGSVHKLKSNLIYIVDIKEISDSEVTSPKLLSYIGTDVMYPVFYKVPNVSAEIVPATLDIYS
ncbi:large subunit ribosomal protein L18Ae [Pancytospora epiphaga]|nr:large subunit ribosomal protein L18Ae [Pancytospora epiphaga]